MQIRVHILVWKLSLMFFLLNSISFPYVFCFFLNLRNSVIFYYLLSITFFFLRIFFCHSWNSKNLQNLKSINFVILSWLKHEMSEESKGSSVLSLSWLINLFGYLRPFGKMSRTSKASRILLLTCKWVFKQMSIQTNEYRPKIFFPFFKLSGWEPAPGWQPQSWVFSTLYLI